MQNDYSVHHRKPTSIGGTDSIANTHVFQGKKGIQLHRQWHRMVNNKHAPEILVVFNRIYNNSAKAHQVEAFRFLFKNLNMRQVCDVVNDKFLDPNYLLHFTGHNFVLLTRGRYVY